MLRELTVTNFRNIKQLSFSPSPQINFIFGDNGAGKSSLLEAVDFLSRGRTFRTRLSRNLIREGSESLTLSATLESGRKIGAQRKGKPGEISVENRLDGENVQAQAEMAAALPAIIFCAEVQKQAQSESKRWRNLLDWGVFHVKPAFRDAWKAYRRALRQRNTLLHQPASGQALMQWNQQMMKQAEILDSSRRAYAEQLIAAAEARAAAEQLPLRIQYVRGWPEEDDFGKVLKEAEADDRKAGYTRYGPHRATLRLLWEGRPLAQRASRGQQKSIGALLLLAQVHQFASLSDHRCVVMVDDLAAEFDERHCRWLLDELEGTGQQVFITATEDDPGFLTSGKVKRFHMKHGDLSA